MPISSFAVRCVAAFRRLIGVGPRLPRQTSTTPNSPTPTPTASADGAVGDAVQQEIAKAWQSFGAYPVILSNELSRIVSGLIGQGQFARGEALIADIPELSERSRLHIKLAQAYLKAGDSVECERLLVGAETESRHAVDDESSERHVYSREDALRDIALTYGDMGRIADGVDVVEQIPRLQQRMWAISTLLRHHVGGANERRMPALTDILHARLDAWREQIDTTVDEVHSDRVRRIFPRLHVVTGEIDKALHRTELIRDADMRRQALEDVVDTVATMGDRTAARALRDRVGDPILYRRLSSAIDGEGADANGPSTQPSAPRRTKAAAARRPPGTYSVTVIDNFHGHDPDERFEVAGFTSEAMAREYAIRRVRASIEQCRREVGPDEDLRTRWSAFGEEVIAGGTYIGLANFADFAAKPASDDETNYFALAP